MSDNLPASPGPNWFVDWVSSGKIPGAVKAIAQLVGGTADAASSWIGIAKAKGDQIQQEIKDETTAKSIVAGALAKAAAKQGVGDQALVERALDQWAGKRLRAQENREDIARKTVEYVAEGEPIDDQIKSPADDWLNIFERHAEDANSEKLRDLWARVLAGEIRKPGSFSFGTLQFFSVLDESLAKTTEDLFSRVVGGRYIWCTEDSMTGTELDDFSTLDDYSLIRFPGLSSRAAASPNGQLVLALSQNVVGGFFEPNKNYSHSAAILSRTGMEVRSIINPVDSEYQINYLANEFKSMGAKNVFRAALFKNGSAFDQRTVQLI